MSGRVYDPKVIEKAMHAMTESGKLILQPDMLPKNLKAKSGLTLDQIDARNVNVEVKIKKAYRVPRVRIANKTITLICSPGMPIALTKDVLLMAAEARRRLRHPNNEPGATPMTSVAYGKLGDFCEVEKGIWDTLVVTVDGKLAIKVKLAELEKEKADGESEDRSRSPILRA